MTRALDVARFPVGTRDTPTSGLVLLRFSTGDEMSCAASLGTLHTSLSSRFVGFLLDHLDLLATYILIFQSVYCVKSDCVLRVNTPPFTHKHLEVLLYLNKLA